MKLIYIAGPITASTSWGIEQNVRLAEEFALRILKLGAAIYCPHTQFRNYHGELPWEEWIKRDLEVLKRCDALFLLYGWESSKGANAENDFAIKSHLPVFNNDIHKLQAWLEEET